MEEKPVVPVGLTIILHSNKVVNTHGAEFVVLKPFVYENVYVNLYEDFIKQQGEPAGGFTHVHAIIDTLLLEGYIRPTHVQ